MMHGLQIRLNSFQLQPDFKSWAYFPFLARTIESRYRGLYWVLYWAFLMVLWFFIFWLKKKLPLPSTMIRNIANAINLCDFLFMAY